MLNELQHNWSAQHHKRPHWISRGVGRIFPTQNRTPPPTTKFHENKDAKSC